MPVEFDSCHCNATNIVNCREMRTCSVNMNDGELCEADSQLPNGNHNYQSNNCANNYDINFILI